MVLTVFLTPDFTFAAPGKKTTATAMEKYLKALSRINLKSGSPPNYRNCLNLIKLSADKVEATKLVNSTGKFKASYRLTTKLDMPSLAHLSPDQMRVIIRSFKNCRFFISKPWGLKGCPFCKGIERIAPFVEYVKKIKRKTYLAVLASYNDYGEERRSQRIPIVIKTRSLPELSGHQPFFGVASHLINLRRKGSVEKVDGAVEVGSEALSSLLCRFQQLKLSLEKLLPGQYRCGWLTKTFDFFSSTFTQLECRKKSAFSHRKSKNSSGFLSTFDYQYCKK